MSTDTQLAERPQQKAIVLTGERGLQFSDMESMYRFAVAVSNSKEFGANITPEQAMMRMQAGAELGLTPIWSLANIFFYQGKPTVWGDGLLGIVLASPGCVDVIETSKGTFPNDDYAAVCEVQRKGRLPIVRVFSVADAKKAQLFGKAVHGSYPKRMLQMRARSWACRDAFADRLRGLGVREELEHAEPKQVQAREVRRVTLPGDEPKQIEVPAETVSVTELAGEELFQ